MPKVGKHKPAIIPTADKAMDQLLGVNEPLGELLPEEPRKRQAKRGRRHRDGDGDDVGFDDSWEGEGREMDGSGVAPVEGEDKDHGAAASNMSLAAGSMAGAPGRDAAREGGGTEREGEGERGGPKKRLRIGDGDKGHGGQEAAVAGEGQGQVSKDFRAQFRKAERKEDDAEGVEAAKMRLRNEVLSRVRVRRALTRPVCLGASESHVCTHRRIHILTSTHTAIARTHRS